MPVTNVLPSTDVDSIFSMEYDATFLEWAKPWENTVFGWGVDIADLTHPEPIILGSMGIVPPDTSPIITPYWAWCRAKNDVVVVPDLWRGNAVEFFIWLATNNGAKRKVGNATLSLRSAYDNFRRHYPDLALD